jgi:hypothetical protein
LNYHVHVELAMADMVESTLSIMAVFSKQDIKPFVKGLPGILSFVTGHY